MRITVETYENFLEHIRQNMVQVQGEMLIYEKREETGYEPDYADSLEYEGWCKGFDCLKQLEDFFWEKCNQIEFDSFEALDGYADSVEAIYLSLDTISRTALPVDSGELVIVTNEEWDTIESLRYKYLELKYCWNNFADFCENGWQLQ